MLLISFILVLCFFLFCFALSSIFSLNSSYLVAGKVQ